MSFREFNNNEEKENTIREAMTTDEFLDAILWKLDEDEKSEIFDEIISEWDLDYIED